MKLLLINPNTTEAITHRLVEAAAAFAPGVEFSGTTGRFGASYIASRQSFCVAGHAAIDAWSHSERDEDGVVVACFGDPGLDALREVCDVPVIGMAEAAMHAAMMMGGRFSIVTGGRAWVAMLQEYAAARHLDGALASVRTVEPDAGALAAQPERAIELLRSAAKDCVECDGASSVILAGAGLVGFAPSVGTALEVPIIDGLQAAVRMAQAVVGMRMRGAPH
jgi:Asp/Glu/hydantoin racemase